MKLKYPTGEKQGNKEQQQGKHIFEWRGMVGTVLQYIKAPENSVLNVSFSH